MASAPRGLYDFQLQQLIARSGLTALPRTPPAPEASLSMGAVPLQAPQLGPLLVDLLHPCLGAWLHGAARPRPGEPLFGFELTYDNHICTEGGVTELGVTLVLPSLVQLVFMCEGCERAVALILLDISHSGPQVYVRCAPLDASRPMCALARADGSLTQAP